jgi:hypothetical protein
MTNPLAWPESQYPHHINSQQRMSRTNKKGAARKADRPGMEARPLEIWGE